MPSRGPKDLTRYGAIVHQIFFDRYQDGDTEVAFRRTDIKPAADALQTVIPDNIGDVAFSVRYRTPLPAAIIAKAPEGMERRRCGQFLPNPQASQLDTMRR